MGRRLALSVALAALALGACAAAEDTDTQQAQSVAPTTTAPVLPDGACVARTKLPNPQQGGTQTIIVDSHFPNAPVNFTVHYKSKDSSYSAQLDGNGHAEVQFSIGHPTANFTVNVDVTAGQESCATSFTPR